MLVAGQVYHTTVTVEDSPAQPDSATLTITKRDGTSSPETQTGPWTWANDGADNWSTSFDYTLPSPGLYEFAWVTEGPGTAPPPEFENVSDFISLVSKNDVHQHLNKVSTADDDELARYMMAATELVESKIGICVARQFTERVDARPEQAKMELVLARYPILSVQQVASVWPSGPVWTPPDVAADGDAGVIYTPGMFAFYWGPWDVTVTCGRAVIKEVWRHACLEQIRHLWETQRGSQPPALLQGEEVFTATTGFTFSVPRRVLELLEQDMVPSI